MYKNNEQLLKMNIEELTDIAEKTLFFQLITIRKISNNLLNLEINNNKNKERLNIHVKLIRDLSDNAHNLPDYIKKKNKKGLIFELSGMAELLTNISIDNILISELDAYTLINFYKDKGLITLP